MSAFNNNDRTRKASLRSVFWSAMKQEFQRGFAEGFESTSGINLGATPAASATTTPAWTFTQAYTAPVQELTINGRPLSDVETLKLKIMGYQPLPNDYW